MKLTTTTGAVDTAGLADSTNFSIKMNQKAFRILLDGLYSDKIGAVIRELCTNAYDAHLAIGNGDVPFIVQLPSIFDPTFRVRDYGVSMTHEQTMRLMSTVFESSKDESNTQVGAFGLGSKSPFCLVDTFSLTVWKDGEKRIYSAFIGSTGVPSLALLATEQSNEKTGVQFEMTIDPKDVQAFKDKAETILRWFPTIPAVTGGNGSIKAPETLASGNGWSLLKSGNSYYTQQVVRGAQARQGCVVYPLSANAIPNIDRTLRTLLEAPMVIDFPIGTLEVAASREGLSYDQRTCANIIARLNSVVDEIKDHYGTAIADAPTLWEAMKKLHQLQKQSSLPASLINIIVSSAKWDGKSLGNSYETKFDIRRIESKLGGKKLEVHYFDSWRVSRSKPALRIDGESQRHAEYFSWTYGDDRLMVYFTLKSDRPHLEGHRIAKAFTAVQDTAILLFVVDKEDEAKAIIDTMGNPTRFMWTKDLPPIVVPPKPPKKAPVKKGETKKEEIRTRRLVPTPDKDGGFVFTLEAEVVVPLAGEAYFVFTKDGYVQGFNEKETYRTNTTLHSFVHKLNAISWLGYVDTKLPVYVISVVYDARVEKFGQWTDLITHVKTSAEKGLLALLTAEMEAEHIGDMLYSDPWSTLLSRDKRVGEMLDRIKTGALHTLRETLAKHSTSPSQTRHNSPLRYLNAAYTLGGFGVSTAAMVKSVEAATVKSVRYKEISEAIQKCVAAYPLLRDKSADSFRRYGGADLSTAIEYIEAVDTLRRQKAAQTSQTTASAPTKTKTFAQIVQAPIPKAGLPAAVAVQLSP